MGNEFLGSNTDGQERDILDVFADLVRRSNPDLEDRLGYQEEALTESQCIQPVFGNWVDANDVTGFLSALPLPQRDWDVRYPALPLALSERVQLAESLEGHLERCGHCSLKRGYELEQNAAIKRAGREHAPALLELLGGPDEDNGEGESGHQ